jgi:hypothetical protein
MFIHLFRNIRSKLLVNGNGPIQTKIKFTPQVSVYVITSNLFKILYHLNTKNKTTRPPHQTLITCTSPKEKHKPITLRKIIRWPHGGILSDPRKNKITPDCSTHTTWLTLLQWPRVQPAIMGKHAHRHKRRGSVGIAALY